MAPDILDTVPASLAPKDGLLELLSQMSVHKGTDRKSEIADIESRLSTALVNYRDAAETVRILSAKIPDIVLDLIVNRALDGRPTPGNVLYDVDDEVIILDGPFANYGGTVVAVGNDGRLTLQVMEHQVVFYSSEVGLHFPPETNVIIVGDTPYKSRKGRVIGNLLNNAYRIDIGTGPGGPVEEVLFYQRNLVHDPR
jgi:hypothetical protein